MGPAEEANSKCWTLGVGSALMIVSGYKGELILSGDLSPRWASWCLSMRFFLYIVYSLMIGMADATNSESDPVVKQQIRNTQLWTVVSISDIISKCGVGLMIYQITITKSNIERASKLLA